MEKSTEQQFPKRKSNIFEYKKKVFDRKITLDELLKRKKIYPFQSKYTWDYMYKKCIKENRHLFPRFTRGDTILKKIRKDIIDTFNKIMIEDMIYNHTIVEMPYRGVYLFLSQHRMSKDETKNKLDLKTGMYKVSMRVYYREPIQPVVKYKYKNIILKGEMKKMLDTAIEKGHRYPMYNEVINFIESQHV